MTEAAIIYGSDTETGRRTFKVMDSWKKDLALALITLKVIDKSFTGKLIVNVSQGGVTEVEKVERLK